ncbi:MAG: response regulator [Alphaproteobacteria bacterium]|nr:response regulator [Alphaproteobacteria bacterium]
MRKSLADIIAPEVPYLRRYARALTGSQDAGDAYVVATIEAIAEDTSTFASELGARTALYRAFLKIWDSVAINNHTDTVDDSSRVGAPRTLQSLTPKSRQALLLTSLERFSAIEAAAALDIPTAELAEYLGRAAREVADQVRTRVLIIEDEMLIATDIKFLVTSLGHSVTGIARTREEAVRLAHADRPGLVLSDINLADGSSGVDAVHELNRSFDVPVIFITAYPERLLTGDRREPTFLITKPYEEETVKAVIGQALFFNESEQKIVA